MLLLVVDTVVNITLCVITFLTYATYYIICNLFKYMIELDILTLIYIQMKINIYIETNKQTFYSLGIYIVVN